MNIAVQRTRRSVLGAVAGAAAVPFLAAACGGTDTSQPTTKTIIPGKVLVLSYQTSSPRVDRQIANYEAFNKEYKPQGLEVEFVNPGMAVMQKVTTLHVAGTPADMWEYHALWRDQEGMIAELTPFLTRDKIDEKQWLPEAIAMMKAPTPWPPPSGAKIWGMPVSISADAMAYNLELFEANGIKPPPQDPDDRAWTMDAFAELATKLTKGTTQFGWGGSYTPGNEWLNGASYFGYGPVDLATKKITIDTAGYRSAHQYWFDLFNRRHVAPVNNAELEALRTAPGQSAFLTGKVAMDRISNFPTKPDFRWGVAALPYTPNPAQPKSVAGRISVHGLYMDSESKNKEQAWQVFRYWMRPDKNQDYVWSDGHVVSPLVKTGSEQSLKQFQESVNVADAKAFLRQSQRSKIDGWGLFLLKNWSKADAEIVPVYTDARAGKVPVTEFTTKAQESVTRLTAF
jgi:ABC-type glycerol-3-phosphate transport system substrate-binding protein